jgi:hypothetical protein
MKLTTSGIDPPGMIASTIGKFTQELLCCATLFGIVIN